MKKYYFPDLTSGGLLTIEMPTHGGVSLIRLGKKIQELVDWDNRKDICGIGITTNNGTNLVNLRNFIGQKHWPIKLWNIHQIPAPSTSSLRELGMNAKEIVAYPGCAQFALAALHDLAHDWAGTQGRGRFTWKFESENMNASCVFNYQTQMYDITFTCSPLTPAILADIKKENNHEN